jgi:uncharacterized membrane protein YeaQ/YmgE (transglycosylase-associated protein family)
MDIVILIVAMIVVGVLVGALAGVIWKGHRPYGARGDYIIAIAAAVITGILDWFIIPAIGFSDTIKILGTVTEPPLVALGVLWLVRRARPAYDES